MTTLTPEQVTLLQEAAYETGVRLREHYSGRGMYGTDCIAVTCGRDNPGGVAAFVLAVAGHDVPWDGDAALATALARAAGTRTDQMGKGTITYWPEITAARPPEGNGDD